MEEAIKRAIEAGWKKDYEYFNNRLADMNKKYWQEDKNRQREAVLDPEFWRCLGKAEGWGQESYFEDQWDEEAWKKQMHSFIDHIAEEKSIDSFFKSLLKGGITSGDGE